MSNGKPEDWMSSGFEKLSAALDRIEYAADSSVRNYWIREDERSIRAVAPGRFRAKGFRQRTADRN